MSLFNILLLVSFIVIVVGFNIYNVKLDRDIAKERKKREEKFKAIYQTQFEELITGLNDIKPLKEDVEITLRNLANQSADTKEPQFMLLFMSIYILHAVDAGFDEIYTNLNQRGL